MRLFSTFLRLSARLTAAAKSCLGWKMVRENLEQCLWFIFCAYFMCGTRSELLVKRSFLKLDKCSLFWKAVTLCHMSKALIYQKKDCFSILSIPTVFENDSKCRFLILAFSTNFCPIKIDLYGNTVWPQASGFQKLAKMDHFWHF